MNFIYMVFNINKNITMYEIAKPLQLYETLYNECKNSKNKLRAQQKKTCVAKVKDLDGIGYERLYLLIKSYQINNESDHSYIYPYGGEANGSDITFNIDRIPLILSHMIYKFVNLHHKKMKEDKIKINNCISI